ncbi:hypothetical protein SKAU_G00156900 [Synaphobranchus kaupii]|uniref:Uncharacterized protein n=1 Tax=Synaphobranchus kaupii TaxID=118154 RepID=A0A9Q1FIA8_SYNKA|nr:hypothetical protein SKAU_G00156900 [Synaphobranchus kaupii]
MRGKRGSGEGWPDWQVESDVDSFSKNIAYVPVSRTRPPACRMRPDNIWETGWLFATIPKEHLIMDHPPLTMSSLLVLLSYMYCLPLTDGRWTQCSSPETLMRSPS